MGYDATFDALITVSKSVDKEAIIQRIKDAFDVLEVWTDDKAESSIDLWFGEYAGYNEESIYAFLAEIEPYTISGEIIYTGEDSSNWRHVFDSEAHEWVEQDGYIAYQENGKRSSRALRFWKNLQGGPMNRCLTITLNLKGRCWYEQYYYRSIPTDPLRS